MELTTDVCVIGSGAGGAPVATELALAGAKVILIEAGGPAPLAKLGEPVFKSFRRMIAWKTAHLSVARGIPANPIVHGRCEGGSTALNAGSAFRLPEFLARRWEAAGTGDLREYFNRADTFLQVSATDPQFFGRSGELMLEGVRAKNWKGGAVPRNAPGCTGRAICVAGCPEKAKRATHISYLPVAREHGAQVLLNTQARKLRLKGRTAAGVDAVGANGEEITIHAGKTVVSAGAVLTPPLLERSGVEVPGLGGNFLLHPGGVLAVHFGEPIDMGGNSVPQSTYCDEFLESEGSMILLGSVPPQLSVPALLFAGALRDLSKVRNTAFWGALIRDEGNRGRVSATRKGRDLRYALGAGELRRLRTALLRVGELAFAAGARAVTPILLGSKRSSSLRELEKNLPDPLPAWRLLGGSVHPMGTCGIGRVCEGDGRVRGYEKLYVSDASLFPTSIGVNPQFTIMALATRVAMGLLDGVG